MKKFIFLACVILFMPGQYACRTNKLKNRQVNQFAAHEQTDKWSREQENINLSRSLAITDSSGQVYQITIFPKDSFQFSPERGFVGKASKVELKGSIRQLNRINNSTAFIVSKDSETEAKLISKLESKQLNHSKSLEKRGPVWWKMGLVLVLVLFVVWVYWRFIKN